MARSHEHSRVTPLVILALFGIFVLVAMMGSMITNQQSRTVDRSFAQIAGAHPTATRTPTPRLDCTYYSSSTCQNSSNCNQTYNYCSTDNCPRNSVGGLKARCVQRRIGGAPPQGSQCGWFNVNGQQRYGCQTSEGFCDQGGAGTGSTFNSYCVGGTCSGTSTSCIDNRWVFTPTPIRQATPTPLPTGWSRGLECSNVWHLDDWRWAYGSIDLIDNCKYREHENCNYSNGFFWMRDGHRHAYSATEEFCKTKYNYN